MLASRPRLTSRRAASALALCALALLGTRPAAAQLTLAHDTLSRDTPTALTCGFCAGEAFGVVFREIGPTAGLRPGHFPITLQSVQIALADASLTASGCTTEMDGGVVSVVVEIWAGVTVPEATPPSAAAAGEPWATDETLVWAADAVPITLSTPTAAGGTAFDLQLNSFTLQSEDGSPVVVPAPNTYLRVVVTLPPGGTSTACDGLSMEGPGGFPLRDNDGRIEAHRSFIFASGAAGGWMWNETVGINGDWGVRLIVQPMGTGGTDAGPRDGGGADAGAEVDAGGALDAAEADGGTPPSPGGGGCTCRTAHTSTPPGALTTLALLGLAALAARRRDGRGVRAR